MLFSHLRNATLSQDGDFKKPPFSLQLLIFSFKGAVQPHSPNLPVARERASVQDGKQRVKLGGSVFNPGLTGEQLGGRKGARGAWRTLSFRSWA